MAAQCSLPLRDSHFSVSSPGPSKGYATSTPSFKRPLESPSVRVSGKTVRFQTLHIIVLQSLEPAGSSWSGGLESNESGKSSHVTTQRQLCKDFIL